MSRYSFTSCKSVKLLDFRSEDKMKLEYCIHTHQRVAFFYNTIG
jgi:hypothetical protein